jgi:hypothetical protein
LNTWSATLAAKDGQQYASTYAAGDTIRQSVSFAAPGQYRIEAYAASPAGSLTIPTVGTFTLQSGEFAFTLAGSDIGGINTVATGAGWSLFSADFVVANAGSYQLGIRNTKAAPYFINYDGFAIEPVPEPAAWHFGLGFALVAPSWSMARRWRGRPAH